jgi:hypothetical protein
MTGPLTIPDRTTSPGRTSPRNRPSRSPLPTCIALALVVVGCTRDQSGLESHLAHLCNTLCSSLTFDWQVREESEIRAALAESLFSNASRMSIDNGPVLRGQLGLCIESRAGPPAVRQWLISRVEASAARIDAFWAGPGRAAQLDRGDLFVPLEDVSELLEGYQQLAPVCAWLRRLPPRDD